MEIKPIEVLTNDTYLLSQLLSLVDREDFLTDVQAVREKKLKMTGLYDRSLTEELYKFHYGFSLGLIRKQGFLSEIEKLCKKYKNVSKITLSIDMPISFAIAEANILLRKYDKNLGYMMAIVYAILCGKIKDGDYTSNTQSILLTPEILNGPIFEPPFNYVTLVISPESTPEEVQEVFKKAYTKHFYRRRKPYIILNSHKLKSIAPETRSKIRDFRKWYWMNHKSNSERMGYRKISQTTGVTMETIRSGILSYKELLKG